MPPSRDALPRSVAAIATVIVALVTTVQLGLLLLRPEGGFPGLLQVLSPHMTLVALALVPLSLVRGSRRVRVDLLVLALICVVRFGGEWVSLPRPVPADALRVTTWNLEVGARSAAQTVESLRTIDADLVLIQELTSELGEAIGADPQLAMSYPHRALSASDTVAGLGVLSRHELSDEVVDGNPIMQSVLADVGGRSVRVVNAHPLRAPFSRFVLGVPTGYSPLERNEDLESIRATVDGWIAAGETVVLAGDFNTASSEPAFGRLTGGLHDAHAEVGLGTGWTWRPSRLEWLGIGLLRLDLVLTGPGLEPVATHVSCPRSGDHCLVSATLGWVSR
jgi:vancomycin resistance protein VanJ